MRYRKGGDRATAFSAAPTVRSQQPLVQSIHRLNRLVWLSLFICINFALWITFLFVNDIVTSLFHRLAEVFFCVCKEPKIIRSCNVKVLYILHILAAKGDKFYGVELFKETFAFGLRAFLLMENPCLVTKALANTPIHVQRLRYTICFCSPRINLFQELKLW